MNGIVVDTLKYRRVNFCDIHLNVLSIMTALNNFFSALNLTHQTQRYAYYLYFTL